MNLPGRLNLKSQNFYLTPLFALAIFENLIAATWNVDPYHEGALFPTAVGLAEGLAPFKEINQQYGFLGPLVVSLPLHLFGNYLIVQRLFGFFLTILIALLFFSYLKILTNKTVAEYITLIWMSISPIWSWSLDRNALSGGYWPNQLGTFLVLLGLLLLKRSRSAALLAGFFIFLSSQARVEFIFVWLFISVAILIKEKEKRIFWAFGSSLSILVIFFYLMSNDSVSQWFEQTLLVWTMNPPDLVTIDAKFLILNLINFLAVSIIGVLLLASAWGLMSKVRKVWISVFLQSVLVCIFLSIPRYLDFQIKIGRFDLVAPIKLAFTNTLFSFINMTLLICFILVCFLTWHKRPRLSQLFGLFDSTQFALIGSCVGLLALFHNFNPDYTHMVWPIFASLMISLIPDLSKTRFAKMIKRASAIFALALIVGSSCIFLTHLLEQVHPYRTPMLKGLYGNSTLQVENLDSSFMVIDKQVKTQKVLMACYTGLLSVSTEGYLGVDEWSWNLQPKEMISHRLDNMQKGNLVLACHLSSDEVARINYLQREGLLKLIEKNNSFHLYRVSQSF
ncbi:hypothetical protein [Candidatus Planktophila dulcis]|uniref:hypothetical protein n=1 Tax=Candidatus Planktophila dulcis TaxID=1884914 RepID=UPI003CEC1CA9